MEYDDSRYVLTVRLMFNYREDAESAIRAIEASVAYRFVLATEYVIEEV